MEDSKHYLYSVVFFVAYVDEPKGVGGDAPGVVEPPVRSALRPERSEKPTWWIHHLEYSYYLSFNIVV